MPRWSAQRRPPPIGSTAVQSWSRLTRTPRRFLRGSTPLLLCDPAEKAALLGAAGADYVVIQPFDQKFADQPAAAFLKRLAAGRALLGIVMTPETAFGRDRDGTLAAVEGLAPTLGLELIPSINCW
jgi:FAD synthase